jgi:hypothetical protein
MNVSDVSNTAGAYLGGAQLDSVSGASSYVPTDTSTDDSAIAQMRSDIQQNSQDFQSLNSALSSNNLTAATQSYATLQQDIQNASSSAGGKSPFDPSSPIGKDFQAIGTALKSGDLSAAKKAFTAFKTDIKSAGWAARAHSHPDAGTADGTGDSTSTTPTPTANPSNVGGILNTTA